MEKEPDRAIWFAAGEWTTDSEVTRITALNYGKNWTDFNFGLELDSSSTTKAMIDQWHLIEQTDLKRDNASPPLMHSYEPIGKAIELR